MSYRESQATFPSAGANGAVQPLRFAKTASVVFRRTAGGPWGLSSEANRSLLVNKMSSNAQRRVRYGSAAVARQKVLMQPLKKGSGWKGLAGTTGLEPATSDVTGRRSNQLNYVPMWTNYVGLHQNTTTASLIEVAKAVGILSESLWLLYDPLPTVELAIRFTRDSKGHLWLICFSSLSQSCSFWPAGLSPGPATAFEPEIAHRRDRFP